MTTIGRDRHEDDLDPVEREAIAWIQRLASGQMTVDEAKMLKLWRNRSPAHAAALSEARRLWDELGPAGESLRARIRATVSPQARSQRLSRRIDRRFALGGGLAAVSAAVGYSLVSPPLALWPSLTELRADYRTATGEHRDVALSPRVSVRMNTQTAIAVRPGDATTERVELIDGEASFSTLGVGPALSVLAADRWITAVTAARFGVQHLRDWAAADLCVSCLDGTLTVAGRAETKVITAGQQLRYRGDDAASVQAIDVELVSAWQQGVLIFRSTPLADVVEEVNRYRPGRIILTNARMGRLPVSGRFRIDNLDEILADIERGFGLKVRALPGGLVLLS
jgi:transmembrane sensor